MKIAIVGTGISGLGAAWLLSHRHEITVYEKEARIGGHSNTITVDYDGVKIPVDTGFIVYNTLNYPNLTGLFRHLDVGTKASDMSFALSAPHKGIEWSSDSVDTIFAYRRNMARPSFLRMLYNIYRFNKIAVQDLGAGYLDGLSLQDYLRKRGFSEAFRDHYLIPMGAAIWSTSSQDMLDFPASSFVAFFDNHRLVSAYKDRPQWRTVVGGSKNYVNRITSHFEDRIRLNAGVHTIKRAHSGVEVSAADGSCEHYDHVILACHSDQALAMLQDPSTHEQSILSAMRYSHNEVYLHRDPDFMPKRQKTWASWNYMTEPSTETGARPASVTYWMNRLQGIDTQFPLFVSLNPARMPRPDLTFERIEYMHPLFDSAALQAQKQFSAIQGVNRTWFCGAYTGYGFHEDGLVSGLKVAEQFGVRRPWTKDGATLDETSKAPVLAQAAE